MWFWVFFFAELNQTKGNNKEYREVCTLSVCILNASTCSISHSKDMILFNQHCTAQWFFNGMYFFIKNSPNPPTSALPDIVPIPAEVKTSPTLPNFPSDLEDLDLEPIKSDPSLIPNVYSPSEYANTPVNELPVKEEPSDEEMQGTWSSY